MNLLRSLLQQDPPRIDWKDFTEWNQDETREPHGTYDDWRHYEAERWKRGSHAWLATYLTEHSTETALERDLAESEKRRTRRNELRDARRAMLQGWLAIYGFFGGIAELIPLTNNGQLKDYMAACVATFLLVGLPTATGMRWWYESLKDSLKDSQ